MATLPLVPQFAPATLEFLNDAVSGLSRSQKELPPKYFYDGVGSALFETITVLPEYGVTRADERLLRLCAPRIAEAIGRRCRVIELGCGTGRKTRWILEALGRRTVYHPIDVSPDALKQCETDLSRFACVVPSVGTYLDGLHEAAGQRNREPLLVLFLGSTIGNFDPNEREPFLRAVRSALRPGDRMLIGFDLVKERSRLLAAYDDPTGVTAAFNRNVLARMNRELDANFNLRWFEHVARWDAENERIEMHLQSTRNHSAFIGAAGRRFHFDRDESIRTEYSHKFRPAGIRALAAASGFEEELSWQDAEWPFIESLWLCR